MFDPKVVKQALRLLDRIQGGQHMTAANTKTKTAAKKSTPKTAAKVAAKRAAKVAKKAAKPEKKLCSECKQKPPRTPRAERCTPCQKAIRKQQLADNNVTWRERVAKGQAGHHKQYRGKPTTILKLVTAAGLDPAKYIKQGEAPPKTVQKKLEAVAPEAAAKVKTLPKPAAKTPAKKTARQQKGEENVKAARASVAVKKAAAKKIPAEVKKAKRSRAKKSKAVDQQEELSLLTSEVDPEDVIAHEVADEDPNDATVIEEAEVG